MYIIRLPRDNTAEWKTIPKFASWPVSKNATARVNPIKLTGPNIRRNMCSHREKKRTAANPRIPFLTARMRHNEMTCMERFSRISLRYISSPCELRIKRAGDKSVVCDLEFATRDPIRDAGFKRSARKRPIRVLKEYGLTDKPAGITIHSAVSSDDRSSFRFEPTG